MLDLARAGRVGSEVLVRGSGAFRGGDDDELHVFDYIARDEYSGHARRLVLAALHAAVVRELTAESFCEIRLSTGARGEEQRRSRQLSSAAKKKNYSP